MPRKRNEQKEQNENYSKAFPTVMRYLMQTTTQAELAGYLSKTRQSITYYCDGSSSPDWETLVKIADYFDVTTDYLLGRTADPKRSPSAMDELGLSGDALIHLRGCKKDGSIDAMNLLLENYRFIQLVAQISRFVDNISRNTLLSKQYQANVPIPSGRPDDYNKAQYVLGEERMIMELSEIISTHFPEIKGNFSIHVGSYFVENQKRSIEDLFSEILRQISNYDEFRENMFRLDDFFKER